MSFQWNNYLDGSLENWNKVMPEDSLDDVISLLNLDPDKIMGLKNGKNLKESLWNELATILYVWGRPSESRIKTSPKNILQHTQKIEKTLSKTLEFIEEIERNAMSLDWVKTREMITADLIQGKADDPALFMDEVNDLKARLQNFLIYTNNAADDLKPTIKNRGASKPSEGMHDRLILELCKVYKRYTGKEPISWNTGTASLNPNQFTGDILYLLQSVLSKSFYGGDITPGALQKILIRMKNSGKHSDVWQDTKK